MYQLQLLFHNQGNWENTVFKPMSYQRALTLCQEYNKLWADVHTYRIIAV